MTNGEMLDEILRKTFPRTIFIRGINELNKTQSIVFSDEWLKMPSVQPETCEDAISRREALECFEMTNTRPGAKHAIETLPSVQPTDCIAKISFDDQQMKEMIDKAISNLDFSDLISRQAVNDLVDELARAISDERCCIQRGRSTATIMQDIIELPSVQPEPKTGYISIADVMSVFDDFMCGEVDEDGTETFLEMLKDKVESEDE